MAVVPQVTIFPEATLFFSRDMTLQSHDSPPFSLTLVLPASFFVIDCPQASAGLVAFFPSFFLPREGPDRCLTPVYRQFLLSFIFLLDFCSSDLEETIIIGMIPLRPLCTCSRLEFGSG